MQYNYMVVTSGMSAFNNLESFGDVLQTSLNEDANAERGWELWQVHVLNDHKGNNGFIYVYRRPKL